MGSLIAEDLLLLTLRDSGAFVSTTHLDTLLGGALLSELALDGAVRVGERSRLWRTAKVEVVPGAAVEDDVLRECLAVVAEKPRTAQDLVTRLGKGRRERLGTRLVARGVLQRRDRKVLGLIPATRWPVLDPSRRRQLERDLAGVLLQGLDPDPRTGTLVALLTAAGRAEKVVDHRGVSARTVRRRAKQVAEAGWAVDAVRDAIRASTAAISAVAAGGAVAGSAGG